jgi:hypothetical protein
MDKLILDLEYISESMTEPRVKDLIKLISDLVSFSKESESHTKDLIKYLYRDDFIFQMYMLPVLNITKLHISSDKDSGIHVIYKCKDDSVLHFTRYNDSEYCGYRCPDLVQKLPDIIKRLPCLETLTLTLTGEDNDLYITNDLSKIDVTVYSCNEGSAKINVKNIIGYKQIFIFDMQSFDKNVDVFSQPYSYKMMSTLDP